MLVYRNYFWVWQTPGTGLKSRLSESVERGPHWVRDREFGPQSSQANDLKDLDLSPPSQALSITEISGRLNGRLNLHLKLLILISGRLKVA